MYNICLVSKAQKLNTTFYVSWMTCSEKIASLFLSPRLINVLMRTFFQAGHGKEILWENRSVIKCFSVSTPCTWVTKYYTVVAVPWVFEHHLVIPCYFWSILCYEKYFKLYFFTIIIIIILVELYCTVRVLACTFLRIIEGNYRG